MGGKAAIVAAMLSCIFASGCWHDNRPTSVAVAMDGEMGYGLRTDTRGMFLLFAWSETSITTTGTVAASLPGTAGYTSPDLVWRCHPHGIELCGVRDGGAVDCRPATGATVVGGICVVEDPMNLGSFFLTQRGSGYSTGAYAYMYGEITTSSGYAATLGAGVWISTLSGNVHCQVENGEPMCRPVDLVGAARAIRTIERNGERVDVIWYAALDRVSRCEASPSQPLPVCQNATFE